MSLDTSSPSTAAPAGPGRGWITALVLATVGVAIGWYGPIQILLPAQAELVGAGGKEALLAIVTGSGAAGAMIANPLWGLLSDGLHARGRSRLPVLVIGALLGITGLLVLAFADSTVPMIVGWVATQVGLNGPFAVLAALIADRVPEERRGLVGSLFGVAQLIGTVVGTIVAVAVGEGAPGYVAVAIAVPLLIAPILFTGRTSAAPAPTSVTVRHVSWRALRIDRVYAAAFALRFLLNLVSALGLLYLYYFLSDRARVDDPATWVLVLTVCYVAIAGVAAGLGGPTSDRLGRRIPLAMAAAIVLAIGAVVLAFAETMPLIVVAVVVLGAGYGLFLAVDVAIVTDSLPNPDTRATLLGVANIASSLPQVLAPVIAAPIVTSIGGYPLLYLATGGIALVSLIALPFLRRRVDARAAQSALAP